MAKLWRIWKGATRLELSDELTYRFNFLIKSVANIIFGAIGPLVAFLIYNSSLGIPGWSFEEFLLLTGTFILATSLSTTFFDSMTWRTVDKIWRGLYDIDLIRPVRPLALATINTFNPDGLPNLFVGLIVVNFALLKLGWIFSISHLVSYILLIGLALLFLYSIDVIVLALAFLVTKSWVVMNIFDEILGIGKNPLTIFGMTGMILFTFILPVGLAAFYPASAILGRLSTIAILQLALIAFAFFGFALLLWSLAIKKYASAGG